MTYIEAILAHRPGAKCSVNEETGEITEWIGKDKPTREDVQAWKAAEAAKPKPLTMEAKVEILWAERKV